MMRDCRWIAVGMVLALGCGGGGDSESFEANECVVAGSSYLVESSERDPESALACGERPDEVLIVPSSRELPLGDGCRVVADEGTPCHVINTVTCDLPTSRVTFTSSVDWLPDGSGGTGVQMVTIALDSGDACSSTYDMVATRL